MQSTSDESEALTRETPAAPALDPQRITIQIDHGLPTSHQKLKYAVVGNSPSDGPFDEKKVWFECEAIKRKWAHAVRAVKELCRHRALLLACALQLLVMCYTAASTSSWFESRNETASRWARIMETTGFEDWPRLKDPSYAPEIFASILIGVSAVSLVLVPCGLLFHSGSGTKLAIWSTAVLMLTVSMRSSVLSQEKVSISGEAVESIMMQTRPVANFNRGYCYVWCRRSEAGLVALARGECGPKEKTVFDELSDLFDVKEWCTQAIAHQDFDLLANYSGTPPFAGLKGEADQNLTDISARFARENTLLLSLTLLPLPQIIGCLIPSEWT